MLLHLLAMGEGGQVRGRCGNPRTLTNLAKRTPLFNLASNRAPSNNDDKTTTPLPFPPRELVHAPDAIATRPTSQRRAPTRAGVLHVSTRGLGRSRGGLGLGRRVFGGVAVGCVGRNAVLLDLILY